MQKAKYLYVFISLFFLLAFSSKALAYQSFDNNPFLSGSYSGYLIEDFNTHGSPCYCVFGWCVWTCANQTTGFNDSYNSTNFLSPDSNGEIILNNTMGDYSNETLRIIPLNQHIFLHTDNTTLAQQYEDNYGWLTIPKGDEAIVNLQMRINGTSNYIPNGVDSPVIIVYQAPYSYGTNYIGQWVFQRNTSSETVISPMTTQLLQLNDTIISNYTFVLPSDIANDRVNLFALSLRWFNMLPNTTIEISKFNIYTLDYETTVDVWQNNKTEMSSFFCGNNTQDMGWFYSAYIGGPTTGGGVYDYWQYSPNVSYLIRYEPDSQSACGAFRTGNYTTVHRFTLYGTNAGAEDSHIGTYFSPTGNYIWIQGAENGALATTNGMWLLNELTTNKIKITMLKTTSSNISQTTINFFGSPVASLDLSNLTDTYPNAVNQEINITPYLNYSTPAGTKFMINLADASSIQGGYLYHTLYYTSPYFSIFNTMNVCPTQYVCTDNTQYVQTSVNGTCTLTNGTYCGDAGCLGNVCKQLSLITFCNDNTSYQTNNLDGSASLGVCPNASTCFNLTNANGIKCVGADTTIILCVDNTGATVDCSKTLPSNETTDVYANPFNYVSSSIGGLFGLGGSKNLTASQAITALLIALISGVSLALFAMTKKHDGADKILTYTFLGVLTLFTVALSNILLWAVFAVLVIISAGIMTGYFGKLFGGG